MSDFVKINNWSTTRGGGSPYDAPELSELRLQGVVIGHPRGCDGRNVLTSPIVDIDGRVITTRSGTVYSLGRPDQKWLHWLRKSGRIYDPTSPIKVIEEPTDAA